MPKTSLSSFGQPKRRVEIRADPSDEYPALSRTFASTCVSTATQTTGNQIREIEQAGYEVPELRSATEVVSASVPVMRPPDFAKPVERMGPGDVFVVTKFDRQGRNAMVGEAAAHMLAKIPVRVHCLSIQGVDLPQVEVTREGEGHRTGLWP